MVGCAVESLSGQASQAQWEAQQSSTSNLGQFIDVMKGLHTDQGLETHPRALRSKPEIFANA